MDKVRVFINYKSTDRPWGGSNSFLHALKRCLSRLSDVDLIDDKNGDFDLMLLNTSVSAPGKFTSLRQVKKIRECGYSSLFQYLLKRFKRREVKIILRLDGLKMFYADYHEAKGDRVQLDLIKYVDAIIFQSSESLSQFKEVLGEISVQYYVIRNGVNQDIFNMKGKIFWNKKDKLKIFTTSWSANPKKGFGDIASLSHNKDVTVNFVGNWPEEINKGNVNIKPPMSQRLLAEEYKKNDLFFFPSRKEACPNVVFEALSSGLPVVYHPSGGTPEIASAYGIASTNDVRADIRKISEDYDLFIEEIRKDHHIFSIDYAGSLYAEVFQNIYLG